jgi:aspartyl-tRNA(Asn)/glutamyl-tRNA(Gln) amidotransferase subunit B
VAPAPGRRDYETVIGLEVHAQLLSVSKLFCGCSTKFGGAPNTNVCPTCLGLPGSLPVTNEAAVRLAVRTALALDCTINERSIFARKQYFYPDLPKGYQISQYELPFSENGHLDVEAGGAVRRIGIRRVHMEEDAGKNVHGVGGDSLVDLNRAGVPLVEIVSDPDIRSSEEAAAYMRALRDILIFASVNDGNLEEGSFRCDANVSLRPKGQEELGTRTELKNINSFRFVQRAIDVEVSRQAAVLDGGGRVVQETRSFDPATGKTASLRSKEEAHDYRYFPDPDLPPLTLSPALVDEERRATPPLPHAVRTRFVSELGLSPAQANTLSQHPATVRFFEEVLQAFPHPVKAANWIQTEVLRDARSHGLVATFPVTPRQVSELLALVENGDISGKQAKEIHQGISGTDKSPAVLVAERGMRVVSDEATIRPLCERVVAANEKQVAEYRAGKKGILGYFVGQVMKETKGSANPKLVSELVQKLLEEGS